jgi:hypothetical protein
MQEKREKTNSITNLVKIVAREVFKDSIRTRPLELRNIIREICKDEIDKCNWYDIDTFLEPLKSGLENAGTYWSKEEDQLLIDEVKVAVAQIAKNHKRSVGAIIARVQDQEVINCETIK